MVPGLRGKTKRQQFIIKVYGIVLLSLLFTTLCTIIVMASERIQTFMKVNWYLHWVSLLIGVTLMIILSCPCCKKCQRKVPFNYILFFSFCICETYMVAGFCSYYAPEIVLAAATTTSCMVLGLTIFSCCMKSEMVGYLMGFLAAFCFTLIPVIFFAWIYPTNWLYMIILGLIVCLFSLYIIMDTRNILKNYGYDDYIVAALTLYVDIIMIFVYILSICGGR
jgi:FtsH-binding integral membrane protein